MRIRSYHWQSLIAVLLTTAGPVSQASAQAVGSVSAVNPATTGQPPAATAPRVLTIGANVVHKERVRTSSQGSVQISFPDRTTINVGRNSDLLIDEFVYDPAAGTGRLAASLTKGVLRFVGGQVSHTGEASVRTPAATIGIRGGVNTIAHTGDSGLVQALGLGTGAGTVAINHFGTLNISNNVSRTQITRSGYGALVAGPNSTIQGPYLVTDVGLQVLMAQLTSRPGQRGGAIDLPTDAMAARLGMTPPRLSDPNRPVGPLDRAGIIQTGDNLLRDQAQGQQSQRANNRVPRPPVVVEPPVVVDPQPCVECVCVSCFLAAPPQ